MGGIVWQAWCSHECVCPTGTKPGASAQVTQRAKQLLPSWEHRTLLVVLRTMGLASCPVLGRAVLLRELHNWTVRGPGGTGRDTTAEIGLLGYITTCWILFSWCAQSLSGVCSGGGVKTELGVLVAVCRWSALLWNVMSWCSLNCDTFISFCLLVDLVMAYGNSIYFLCAPVLDTVMASDGDSLFFPRNCIHINVAENKNTIATCKNHLQSRWVTYCSWSSQLQSSSQAPKAEDNNTSWVIHWFAFLETCFKFQRRRLSLNKPQTTKPLGFSVPFEKKNKFLFINCKGNFPLFWLLKTLFKSRAWILVEEDTLEWPDNSGVYFKNDTEPMGFT